jgi:anti-sigma B factor antagonist
MAEFVLTADHGAVPVLAVSGELDLSTEHELLAHCDELLATGAPVVDVDLGAVTFIDSSGLGSLVRVQRSAEHAGRQLRLANVPRAVNRILEVTGLDDLFTERPRT